jgi:hypothetical protein
MTRRASTGRVAGGAILAFPLAHGERWQNVSLGESPQPRQGFVLADDDRLFDRGVVDGLPREFVVGVQNEDPSASE